MKYLVLFLSMFVSYAHAVNDRNEPTIVGYDTYSFVTETCIDGVLYLVKNQSITVKYNRDSTVATCQPVKEKTE